MKKKNRQYRNCFINFKYEYIPTSKPLLVLILNIRSISHSYWWKYLENVKSILDQYWRFIWNILSEMPTLYWRYFQGESTQLNPTSISIINSSTEYSVSFSILEENLSFGEHSFSKKILSKIRAGPNLGQNYMYS